jgi:hypothetical protein
MQHMNVWSCLALTGAMIQKPEAGNTAETGFTAKREVFGGGQDNYFYP